MTSDRTLAGRTMLVSGASRGIGLAIALRAARDGANVVLLAKTGEAHPKLPGTVFTAAQEVEAAGGHALPVVGDVRNEADIESAIGQAVDAFGGLDVLVNNAAAIDLSTTDRLPAKRFDLLQQINGRGTFLMCQAAIPHLERSDRAHIVNVSPPLNLHPRWAGAHLGYTISKYTVSLCTLGLADELADRRIAVNSIWPRTAIATSSVRTLLGEEVARSRARSPEIMADAVHAVVTRDSAICTGNFLTDEEVLRAKGISDFSRYRLGAREDDLDLDFFLPESPIPAK